MAHPAVYIATAFVVGAAFLIGFLASRPQATAYGRRRPDKSTSYRAPSPPPSPPPSSARRRRRSPERRPTSPAHVSSSANEQSRTCESCGKSPLIKIRPCNHQICKTCFDNHLEKNDTCPKCHGRIDSCLPPIPPFGKCRNCRKFTKLFKFLDCKHTLSLCIRCFEEQDISYKVCPECRWPIRGSEPRYTTSGICGVCQEFSRFAMFQPCGHGKICRKHASKYLERSDHECIECGRRVTEVV